MNKCVVKDDKLLVYVDPTCSPTTDFAQVCLHNYCQNSSGGMISAVEAIAKNEEFCLVFTPADYIDLANILDKYLTYDLEQARIIIKWIGRYVRDPNDDSIDWAAVYWEILENADVK